MHVITTRGIMPRVFIFPDYHEFQHVRIFDTIYNVLLFLGKNLNSNSGAETMKVKIFSTDLTTSFYSMSGERETEESRISQLEKQVNNFLKEHPDANIQWLQSSWSTETQALIKLTAVVNY